MKIRRKQVQEQLDRLVAYGLLDYDAKQCTYVDSKFSKSLDKISSRRMITNLITRVENYCYKRKKQKRSGQA